MSPKIKVLLLHNIMTPYRYPLFNAVNADPRIDLNVWFMARSAKNRKWHKIKENIRFKYRILPKVELSYFSKDLFVYIINYTFPLDFFRNNFRATISAGWLDFSSQVAFFLSKIMGRKFIIWSESTRNEKSWRRSISLPLVKTIVKGSDACIAIGSKSREYLIDLGAKPDKIFIAYSTVDVNFFKRKSQISLQEENKLKKKFKIKSKHTILYSGQFIDRKGVIYLLEAFKDLQVSKLDLALILVGYGPLKQNYQDFIEENNLKNVVIVNHLEIDQMPKIYALADLFILPSFEETWGLVINEAMACGLPIITTDKVGASSDLVKNGVNGYIIKSKNKEEIVDAVLKIVSNRKVQIKFAQNSLKMIEQFTPEKAAKSFMDALEYSISKK